ncbi:MAG TPA: efflux RND transporter periplasmic adaptor subunit [Candidatus Angelobacter sp.]|nr:efflux RND transporter periplasmic adaptor subunit [Candidatus Angelobacter sp.]
MFVAVLLPLTGCATKTEAAPPPPPEVQVVSVQQKDVPIYGEWVATLDGYINADIRPQVTGYLMKQNYREGMLVRKGEVMFEIDPRPFQAELEEAQGQQAQAEAQRGKTALDVQRDTPLAKQSAIPQAQLDNDIQANAAAAAVVTASKAQVEQARLSVEFTKVRSLLNGIAGLAKGQIGDLVSPTTVLTTVSQIQPVKVYFSVSEQEYLPFAARISEVVTGKRAADTKKNLELILADGSVYPNKGSILVADRHVDAKTGTIRFAAAFENPSGVLRPGQFARVRLPTSVAKDALLVPQRAVIETQGSYQLAVVTSDNKASLRPVKVGERVGDMWIIQSGIQPAERVIVEGFQKVKEGAPVVPKPFQSSGPDK